MYTNHFAHWYFSNPTSNVLRFIILLHFPIYIFRPKTPNRKESTGSSPSRKASNTSVESITSPPQNDLMTRSLSRNSNDGGGLIGKFRRSFSSSSGTKSLGRSSGISFLKDAEHTKETEDTHFIRWIIANRYAKIRQLNGLFFRAATGRGSIKRGPAPTRASVLRQQKQNEVAQSMATGGDMRCRTPDLRSRTPNLPRKVTSPMTPTVRRRAPSPSYGGNYGGSSSSGYGSSSGMSNYMFQSLVRPSVVRPSR